MRRKQVRREQKKGMGWSGQRVAHLSCWLDSTRKQRNLFSHRSDVMKTLVAWLLFSLGGRQAEQLNLHGRRSQENFPGKP